MFYSVKDANYTQRDKRKQDKQEAMAMEERLAKAQEKQKLEDLKLASASMTGRSRIATPGARTPNMRREPGTPAARRGGRMGL
jgi:hypothetical protein